ncbi:hypothetical protein O6H91_05G039000 [Diphasiastrum complanatum]|nr:hypothetical protein O6H91_05G039000 [Diphasiastrum complanatum]
MEKTLDGKADETLDMCAVTGVAIHVEEALRDEIKRGDEAAVEIESDERVEINATGLDEQSSKLIVDSEAAVGKENSIQSVTSSCKLPVSLNVEDTSKTIEAAIPEFYLPLSLSRMYGKKSRKKKGHKQACSSRGFGELVSKSCSRERDSTTKILGHRSSAALACVKSTHKLDMEYTTVIEPYDYATAKRNLAVEKSLASQHEKLATGTAVLQGAKRTCKPKSENHSTADTSFDPLRRMRSELKVQDLRPGKRRQVFPQSGNRTGTFW